MGLANYKNTLSVQLLKSTFTAITIYFLMYRKLKTNKDSILIYLYEWGRTSKNGLFFI
jgi:hypothetical protein